MTTTIQRNHLIHAVCTVVPSEHWGQAERLVDGLPHSTSDNVEGNILAALRVAGLSNYSAQGAQVARVAIEQATGPPQPTAAPASEAPDTSEVVTFDDLVAAISAVLRIAGTCRLMHLAENLRATLEEHTSAEKP